MSARNATPLPLVLAAGETSALYSIGGDRVFVLSSDLSTFLVQFGGQGDFAPLGLGVNPAADGEFTSVKFKNPNATTLTAEVVIGFWNYSDNRMHFAGDGLPVLKQPANQLTDYADVTVGAGATVTVLVSGLTRTQIDVANLGDTVGQGLVRLGTAPAAARGYPLGAGFDKTWEYSGILKAHNPGATAVTLAVTTLEQI